MDKKNIIKYFLIAAILIIAGVCAAIFLQYRLFRQVPQAKVFKSVAWFEFNKQNALDGWEEKIFKGKVIYSVKTDKAGGYLNAYSESAASGILRWLKFDPTKNPMVSWKWKVVKFPDAKQSVYDAGGWMEKDDYAARFYVIFPRFPLIRFQCLEYVWDKNLPKGTVLTNPVFKNLKIIVAESGDGNLGKWVSVERNIYEDFRKLFNTNPPEAGAIAIMTDADNSSSTAEAQYNDIEVGYEKQ